MVSESAPTHVLFGGTFDPPHRGHRMMVDLCLKAFLKAQMVIMPSAQPAGAYGQHKQPKASFEDRWAMCGLAFKDLSAAGRVVIDTLETKLPAPNFTWKTLEALEAAYPKSRWAILLGFDQLQNFAGWQNAEALVDKYDLVAIERPSFDSIEAILPKLKTSLGNLDELAPGVYSLGKRDQRLYVLLGQVSEAASREVRQSMQKALDKSWLDPKVTEYIRQHKLYDESED